MKICWDILEDVRFSKKSNTLRRGRTTIHYHESCLFCGEPFLGTRSNTFCDEFCAQKYMIPAKKSKIITEETRKKLSIRTSGKNNPRWAGGYRSRDLVLYDRVSENLDWCESIRRALEDENILEVRCTYCGKWYKPNRSSVSNRIRAIYDSTSSENRFYCSYECKSECPVYKKLKYPEGFIGDNNSSREVQPELRKLVLERDNWTCQKCGLSSNAACVELHCHHIDPVKLNPIESADVDNCITLCKVCHNEVHQKDGCRYNDLKCT